MNEQVQLLSKKHGQLKQAITRMVQEVITFLDEAPNMETKVETIENIRIVTEGKVSRYDIYMLVMLISR
jgi:26S proteasome regulatory subunit N5